MIRNKTDIKVIRFFNYASNALIAICLIGLFGLLNTSDLEVLSKTTILTTSEYIMFTILYIFSGITGVCIKIILKNFIKNY